MAFFWRCPECDTLGTYDDDERPWCKAYCDYPDDDSGEEVT